MKKITDLARQITGYCKDHQNDESEPTALVMAVEGNDLLCTYCGNSERIADMIYTQVKKDQNFKMILASALDSVLADDEDEEEEEEIKPVKTEKSKHGIRPTIEDQLRQQLSKLSAETLSDVIKIANEIADTKK